MKSHTKTNKGLVHLLGLAVLLFGLFGHARTSEARLDPFFVLRGQNFAQFTPRILFVIDTSGSMTWLPSLPNQGCYWNQCEQAGAGHSRIYAARKAVREVVLQTGDQASFSLMTFGHVKPPASAAQLPTKCYHYSWSQYNRFTWVTVQSAPWAWAAITNTFGTQGTWMLCGDNRPFPYLRHDNLGGFAMPQVSNEVLAEQPLYKTKSNTTGFYSGTNFNRNVQWFNRYLGRRVNLNCADPNQESVVLASQGDWAMNPVGSSTAATVAQKKANICGRDFYYWPYVDGFPGYSYNWTRGPYTAWETEVYDNNSSWTGGDDWFSAGVARRNTAETATLWSPFYSEEVLGDGSFSAAQKGPLTQVDADLTMEGLVSDMYAGGIDAAHGTPWRNAVGDIDDFVTINADQTVTPKAPFVKNNASFTHYSVASYLTFMKSISDQDLCRPTAVVYITDGQPDPWDTEGGSILYERLSEPRRKLGTKSYIVGFSAGFANNVTAWDRLQGMACAAAGSTNFVAPCSFNNVQYNWDTCADPNNPSQGCAWLADDAATLATALTQIIAGVIQTDVPGGPGMASSEFVPKLNPQDSPDAIQTFLSSYTDTDGYKGHVTRAGCDTEDPENPGQLAPWCENATLLPLETEESETYGPCPLSRVWDAGECLKLTPWIERRVYAHDATKDVFRIANDDGTASTKFRTLVKALNSAGKISPALSNNLATQDAEIQALTEFVLGKNMPSEWKLPGVPNSSPILVRRIPKANESFMPTVGIRDPHCAGRGVGAGESDVPPSLKTFANSSWDLEQGGGFGDHYEYAEAVLVGDDIGLMHAFHYDSGNELFALLPMDLVSHARQLSVNGAVNFGQSPDIALHTYGVAATANVGWAFDHTAQEWRHLASWGFGAGGSELLVMDVSHMGKLATDEPVDLLWATSTNNVANFDNTLGQTWSRPALSYMVPGDSMANEPHAFLVFGSGYRNNAGPAQRGRTVWLVDALTGQTYADGAYFQAPVDAAFYDTSDDFAAIADPAVSTHCLSRFWGEMQEAFISDPSGRLFRWDIAPDTNNPLVFPHTSDSGGLWTIGGNGLRTAKQLFRFPACQGTNEFTCTVNAIGGNNKGDLFVFSPAIAGNNKIDPPNDDGGVLPIGDRDQFLIAMVSGSPNDNKTDGSDETNNFHSSLYLMTDDHRGAAAATGLAIPGIGGITPPGTHANFMRLPLSDITRTRTIYYPNDVTEDETRTFSKAARPLRSPFVRVTGAADGEDVLDVEVFYITYTVYEPGEQTCDPKWYDQTTKQWVFDLGATYEITFRLVLEDGQPLSFLNNYALPSAADGFGTGGALSGPVVGQIGEGGMVQKAPGMSPCDPNTGGGAVPAGPTAVQTGWSELQGFSPLEIELQ